MDRVEIGDLRNSGKGGEGNGGNARSISSYFSVPNLIDSNSRFEAFLTHS